jgi:KTSC domain-containing protein
MRLKPVDSDMLSLVGYDSRSRILEVVFNKGGQYQYKEVPASEFKKLMTAESIGKYMHRYIIDRYDFKRVN